MPPRQGQVLTYNSKPLFFWVSSLLALVLAIFLIIPNSTTHYNLSSVKSAIFRHPLKPSIAQRIISHFKPAQSQKDIAEPSPCLLWMAPFLSSGGYSSEAWSYILSLVESSEKLKFKLKIEHNGDEPSLDFWVGLSEENRVVAYNLYNTECNMNDSIVVCHSEPGAWYPPLYETLPCPPHGYAEPAFVVGRTMFETDRLNVEHVRRCNHMDSIWVPTEFHVATFVNSGVDAAKVVKMVQPVDVSFFDPSKYGPFPLPIPFGVKVLGSGNYSTSNSKKFVFLSIFKWEFRKGWDVLLSSYLKEFSKNDEVVLYLLTNPYHTDIEFGSKIRRFVEESGFEEPHHGWAPVYVIDTHIAQTDLPKLYRTANAFVLPTRGEGWGRPLVEAMAMAVPVIATNWSGPTEYLDKENSYPLPVKQMNEAKEGPFRGHLWAEPSVDELSKLMRHVVSNPKEAILKGAKAREDMVRRFAPEVVSRLVIDQVMSIIRDKF